MSYMKLKVIDEFGNEKELKLVEEIGIATLPTLKYVIVRTYSAGVFARELLSRTGREVILLNARRIWYWDGAASLSQLAMEGTSKPDECKFPCEVDRVELLEAIEILDVTEKAKKSIKGVPVWKS